MTFTEIQSAVFDELNYSATPATAVSTRIKRFINEGVRMMLIEPGLERLADSDLPYTFATTANTARYTVPDVVAVIKHLSERTNDLGLDVMDLGTYRRVCPDPTTITGTPTHYVPIGRVGVAVQPSDASAVFFKSTSASDVQLGFIEGIRTGGFHGRGGTALTGVTAVQATSNSDYLEITDLYLATVAIGTVTLLEDSGAGTELARIASGATRTHYYGFYLYPTPSAAVTYYVDYRRDIVDMSQTSDEPTLPPDYHQFLVDYAVMREAEKTADPDRAALTARRFQLILAKLKYQTAALADDLPVAGRGRWVGRSRLGGYYPADYYVRG